MGHKKPKESSRPQNVINVTNIGSVNTQLVISYKYLDNSNKKFSMDLISNNRLRIQSENRLRSKLSEYCDFDNFKKKIKDDLTYRDNNHIHPIEWDDNRIRESSFTSLDDDLMEQIKTDCWQLGVDNQGFRMHGFFVDNVFYIVWLDPEHNLYNRK